MVKGSWEGFENLTFKELKIGLKLFYCDYFLISENPDLMNFYHLRV